MNELEKNVTPDYLLSHGFIQYKKGDEVEICDIPFMNDDDLHFVERDFNRNMFVVIFSKRYEHSGYDHQIYIQEDAGCGFVAIPERWWDLPIEYFESIYYGIHGERPKFYPYAQDCDFEIIDRPLHPKQLPSH